MKPALLLIGHTYAALENRKKLQALAAHFDLVCVTSTMEQRMVMGQQAAAFDGDQDAPLRQYELVRLPRVGPSDTTFRYAGLASVMRSRRFHVVLVENEPWAVVCWQARLLSAQLQPQALFGEFTWENVERPGWKGLVLAGLYQAMSATTDFIIAGNQAAAELVKKRGAHPSTVLVAPQLGVDLSNHLPATPEERKNLRRSLGLPEHAFIIGYCGRFILEKGIPELVQACQQVGHVHLALMGAGVLEPALREQAAQFPWLHLLPPRPHADIPNFLRSLDVFALASKPVHTLRLCWEEQFGHVLIEAMACGVTTIGSDSGAIPEVLGAPEVIFPAGDAQALAACLRRVLQDVTLAGAQLQRVSQHFTHEAVAARWAAFIRQQLTS